MAERSIESPTDAATAPDAAAPSGALTAAMKDAIQDAYRAWLAARDFRPRRGQREMIAFIARTLTQHDHRFGLIEAGTGTGKTAAYVLAAVPVARALGKQIVIGTATIALQEQVVLRDLPDLVSRSGLDFSFQIAKGRGRYLCVKRLDDHLRADGGQASLVLDEQPADHQQLYQSMLEQFMRRAWNGEQDDWDGELPTDAWRGVTTDHRGCANKRCTFFKQCPFFRARGDLEGADVVVANHDLILSDLALGGGAVLSEPQDTIYLIDEAHHLPNKTQSHFTARMRLAGTRAWTDQLRTASGTLAQRLGRPESLVELAVTLSGAADELAGALVDIEGHCQDLDYGERDGEVAVHRFPLGEVPAALVAANRSAEPVIASVDSGLARIRSYLQQILEGELDWAEPSEAEEWLPVLSQLEGRTAGVAALLRDFAGAANASGGPRIARWVVQSDLDYELVSAPVDPGGILDEQFWSPAHAVIMTSATLTSLGRFDAFLGRIGLRLDASVALPNADAEAVPLAATLRIASPFDYPNIAELVVPKLAVEPSDPAAHTDAVAERLPQLLSVARSALVLCTSWRQLRRIVELLPETYAARALVQGDSAKQVLLATHRERIDAGEASYLIGLASFAEGVDLPDDYCRHVIITKLPFAVPDDPLSEATAEWLEAEGRNPFFELQVPDVAMKLIQACGRLIRHEGDYGRITLLDRRVVTRRYGRTLLESLPPYRVTVE
ncbi:MAG: ATP-dependent DNA helicase DinG [Pseudomonadota bacterium]